MNFLCDVKDPEFRFGLTASRWGISKMIVLSQVASRSNIMVAGMFTDFEMYMFGGSSQVCPFAVCCVD